MNQHDTILRAHAPFRRYTSLSSAGIDVNELTLANRERINEMIKDYRSKFTRLLMPKFKVTSWKRASDGPMLNLDEAIAGESECFRRRLPHKSPLRIGINLSSDYSGKELYAIRGAAVLALIDLCKSRGQTVLTDIAYGNGLTLPRDYHCHVRISLVNPSIELLTRITCSSKTMERVGTKCVAPLAASQTWHGTYRFYEFTWKPEYDFVLDRIETASAETEEKRVLAQLEKFKLT